MGQVSPPEKIDATRVILRRVCLDDADRIAEAVRQSLDHLRPWMPRATSQAATVEAQRQRIAEKAWNIESEFGYTILTSNETTTVGGCGFGKAYTGHLAIGY